jgi:predicted PurR-regulated permease PerM
VGIVVFLGLAALVAFACHRWIRPFLLALLISGPLAAVAFQVVVTILPGRPDPLALIAVFTTTLAGWAISLLVGLAMRFLQFDSVSKDGGASDLRTPAEVHDDELPPNSRRK